MTKEQARGILEEFYTNQLCKQIDAGESPWLSLPIKDEVIYKKEYFDGVEYVMDEWTFIALIEVAYNLKTETNEL